MVFTYSPGASARDRIRQRIGDTDPSVHINARLEDAEIDDILSYDIGSSSPGCAGVCRGAAIAARQLAAKLLRVPDGTLGPGTLSMPQRIEQLKQVALEQERIAIGTAIPVATGISISGKAVDQADPDKVQPKFRRDQFDHPGIEALDTASLSAS
jgi:hypothetical protein